jgi:predicted transglutaminase-like cysteine proteinase
MQHDRSTVLRRGLLALALVSIPGSDGWAQQAALYAQIGEVTRPPVGWSEFCFDHPLECNVEPHQPRKAVLSVKAMRELSRINHAVNTSIRPMTDLEHYGVTEKWTYPDDGYGDCEDYALLKRKLLMAAGWPRESLLMTVVREQNGDGHAVLTVKTDRGEWILDNQTNEVRLWSQTPYRFVKRQSQADPNVWIALGDPRAAAATATSR